MKLLDSSGDVLQLRYETRSSFASWVAANQVCILFKQETRLVQVEFIFLPSVN